MEEHVVHKERSVQSSRAIATPSSLDAIRASTPEACNQRRENDEYLGHPRHKLDDAREDQDNDPADCYHCLRAERPHFFVYLRS